MPPTRRSISAIVTSPRFACHQRLTSSGVVHALYTRCLGASNSRVMRICSSVGSVNVAVPLLVIAISFLLPFEVLQHDIQPVQALRPRALVVLHPVMDRLERVAVQPVQPLPSLVAHGDQAHFSEDAQVLGHLWLGQPEHAHQVVHGALSPDEDVQDLAPPALGYRVERICGGRCSCHTRIIFLYGNMSTASPYYLCGSRKGSPCAWSRQLSSRSNSRRTGLPTAGRCSCCTAGPTRRAAGGPSRSCCRRVAAARSCRRFAAPAAPASARRTRRETDAVSRSLPTRSTCSTPSESTASRSSDMTGARASPTRSLRLRRNA